MDTINIPQVANRLGRPFSLYHLARVGHLAVHIYVCMGMLDWHKHPDEDELFLVQEGVIILETELGAQTLHAEELAVVPKGVAHRSGSRLRSVVLLIRPVVLTHRTNGQRRTCAVGGPNLQKHRLARLRQELHQPYQPEVVAGVENYRLHIGLARGASPTERVPRGGLLLISLRGALAVHLSSESAVLGEDEAVLLPTGEEFQMQADHEATYLLLGPRGE